MDNNDWISLRLACYKELGWALYFMDYLHGDHPWPQDQRSRVEELCREAAANHGVAALVYWQKLMERINDEIENMC